MRTFFTLSLICLACGCGNGQPEFSNRAEYDDLMPDAQKYVDAVLANHFGTPTEMVVWDKLPLIQHDAEGTVKTAASSAISFELSEPHQQIRPGTEILWDAAEEGAEASQWTSAWIRDWDEGTHQATLDGTVASPPADGTAVIIGPGQVLARGRQLYAEHCLHCHGVSGDGNGPTAPYLNPRPRDYRKGIFKFTTTKGANRISRDDLHRIIEDGIPGTYMPSFKLLTADEMTSISEYVLWLSMRGELEYQLVRLLADSYSTTAIADRKSSGTTDQEIRKELADAVNDPDSLPFEVDSIVSRMASAWEGSQEEDADIQPLTARIPYSAESIAKGRELYLKESLKCAQCHGEAGYGDGSQTFAVSKNEQGEDNPEPGLYDTWGNKVKPRNLHTGIYRGGRRPIDLYSRIYAGIKGTPMPAFSTTLLRKSDPEDASSDLTDEDIWHLVNYIYSVPFEEVHAGSGADPAPAESDSPAGEEVASN